jgi:NAD(P)-dependent dehydrogenase (short-subunit alcohol dehydrogenase family)
MRLEGRRALITGASQGLGTRIAHSFVADGASVAICARNGEQLRHVALELSQSARETAKVVALPADVSQEQEVGILVEHTLASLGGLDILVCNAGVYGPKGPIEDVNWGEWTQAIAINLLGTVLCCRAVAPHLKRQRSGRIILLSGGGATKPLPFLSAYAASKAAVVRFGETLAEELRAYNITVNAIAPGALNTRLLDEVLEAGPEKVGNAFYEQALKQQREGGTPLEIGASLCVFLASDAASGITGKLISAVWDPWQDLPARAAALRGSDIYTLRRIVPEDRGEHWS